MLLSYRWVFEISVSRSRSESGPGSDSNKTVVLCKGAQVEPPDTKLCFCGLFKKKKKKSARHFLSLWPPLHLRPSLLLLFLHSIFCMQGHSTPHDALRQGREVSRAEQSRADPPIRRENRVEEAGTELVDGWVNSSVSVILATPGGGTSSVCTRTLSPHTADTCSSSVWREEDRGDKVVFRSQKEQTRVNVGTTWNLKLTLIFQIDFLPSIHVTTWQTQT